MILLKIMIYFQCFIDYKRERNREMQQKKGADFFPLLLPQDI